MPLRKVAVAGLTGAVVSAVTVFCLHVTGAEVAAAIIGGIILGTAAFLVTAWVLDSMD